MDLVDQKPVGAEPPLIAAMDVPEKNASRFLIALIVINCVLFMTIQLLQVFIVPIFAAMLADIGAKPLALTQLLIDWTNFVKNRSWGGDPLLGSFALVIAICLYKGVAPRGCLRVAAWFQVLVLLAMLAGFALPYS